MNGDELTAQSESHPDADLFIHPECGCATSALYLACARPHRRSTSRPVNSRAACPYMKMITPAALLRCLTEGRDEVFVDADVAAKARRSVERMIAIGSPGGGE